MSMIPYLSGLGQDSELDKIRAERARVEAEIRRLRGGGAPAPAPPPPPTPTQRLFGSPATWLLFAGVSVALLWPQIKRVTRK